MSENPYSPSWTDSRDLQKIDIRIKMVAKRRVPQQVNAPQIFFLQRKQSLRGNEKRGFSWSLSPNMDAICQKGSNLGRIEICRRGVYTNSKQGYQFLHLYRAMNLLCLSELYDFPIP